MSAWPFESIRALQQAYQDRRISVREAVELALGAAREAESLNAFITLDEEGARTAADAADRALVEDPAGPLTGVPIAHKDIFCTRGVRTTCGSRMLSEFVPPYESTVTERLAKAGAISIGKTNMDEFAMGSSNEHSHFGPARNPWAPERVPGGSSGGSAAAVAAGIVPAATGTDTGGSIRQPAALCGITGIKPTYGRISRWGMIAYASSLDQAGVLAGSAEDCALLLTHMAGFDERDSTSAHQPVVDHAGELKAQVQGLRIGLPRPYWQGMDDAVAAQVHQAIELLESLGARVSEVDLPHASLAVSAYYVIAPCEASANLSRYDGVRFGHRCEQPRNLEDLYSRSRAEGFGGEVKRRILVGTFALSSGYYDAYYATAQKVRRLIAEDFASAFESVDVLAGPTAPGVAFGLGEKQDDPIAMYLADVNTVAVNLAGLPGLSAPAGFVDGLPVGLQLIAPHFQEQRLLDAAHALQQASDWHRQRPGAGS